LSIDKGFEGGIKFNNASNRLYNKLAVVSIGNDAIAPIGCFDVYFIKEANSESSCTDRKDDSIGIESIMIREVADLASRSSGRLAESTVILAASW